MRFLTQLTVTAALASTVGLGACRDSTAPDAGAGTPSRLFFIGNSLTAGNDLPGMVQGLSRALGIEVTVASSLMGGTSLEDHWAIESVRQAVASGGYDVVILQQGPSALPESQIYLREWTVTWNTVIRRAGGVPALYAVWPSEGRSFDFPNVSASYRAAARAVDGILFPVGDAWQQTWAIDPTVPLYDEDRFHPSVVGTYAAAVVMVARLFDRDPRSFPTQFETPSGQTIAIESQHATAIHEGAARALLDLRQELPFLREP